MNRLTVEDCEGEKETTTATTTTTAESRSSYESSCEALALANLEEDPRPPFADYLKLPSNKEIAKFLCDWMYTAPEFIGVNLKEWWNTRTNKLLLEDEVYLKALFRCWDTTPELMNIEVTKWLNQSEENQRKLGEYMAILEEGERERTQNRNSERQDKMKE